MREDDHTDDIMNVRPFVFLCMSNIIKHKEDPTTHPSILYTPLWIGKVCFLVFNPIMHCLWDREDFSQSQLFFDLVQQLNLIMSTLIYITLL